MNQKSKMHIFFFGVVYISKKNSLFFKNKNRKRDKLTVREKNINIKKIFFFISFVFIYVIVIRRFNYYLS